MIGLFRPDRYKRVARHLRIKKVGKKFNCQRKIYSITDMDKQLIAGTYTYVKGNEGLDFWAKLGILNDIIMSQNHKIRYN